MKKIIGLSVMICLLISVMAGFSAFAADKIIYDIDFDSWELNITASTDDAAGILYDISDAETTATNDGWTRAKLSGSSKVSTVEATTENAAWTGRGKVLKLEGSTLSTSAAGDGELSITIPYEGYATSASPYDTDKLVLEYDVYMPDNGITSDASSNQFSYCVFGEYSYNDLYHYRSSETFYAYSRPLSNVVTNADGSLTETHALGFIGNAMSFNKWYHIKWVIDAKDSATYTFSGVDYTGLKTATIYITDLETGTTTSEKQAIYSGRWAGTTLSLGGNHRSSANMEGYYYVDNFELYKKNKFAFVESADDGATNVAIDKAYVDFKMNANVANVSGITLTGGNDTISTFAEVLEDGKTVRVNILEDMKYSTEYTVDFSSITDADSRPVETEKDSITFTTVAPPALYVTETKLYSGSDVYLANAATISADGGLYTVAANVKSTVSENKQATAIVAVYGSNGSLVHTAFVTKNIPALAEETIAAGMTVPAELAGGTVKVFLWNNATSMQPYIKPITANIAAAN